MSLLGSISKTISGGLGTISGMSNISQGYEAGRSAIYDAIPKATGAVSDYYNKAAGGMQPYANFGAGVIPSLQNLMMNPSSITQTPQYQFQFGEGLRGITNQAGAAGKYFSGQTLRDITKFGQGLASTSYQQQFGNLSNLMGMGQQAATTMGGYGMQAGQSLANIYMGGGSDIASMEASQGRDIAAAKSGLLKTAISGAAKYATGGFGG